jgi:pSer/pThr/pTyr-binding forkhead associated (FHA) protein
VSDVYCNACGHRNREGSNFCSSCGEVLDAPAGEEHATIVFHPQDAVDDPETDISVELDRVPADQGLLVVRRGPGAGSRFALSNATTTLGRHPESDIFLDDVTVSRRHAEIDQHAGAYVVRDSGSLNGTYVNRHRIEEVELHNGDELQVGTFKLVFFASPQGG